MSFVMVVADHGGDKSQYLTRDTIENPSIVTEWNPKVHHDTRTLEFSKVDGRNDCVYIQQRN